MAKSKNNPRPVLPDARGHVAIADEFETVIDDVPVRFLFADGQDDQLVCFRIEVGPDPDILGGDPLTLESMHRFRVKPITTQTLRKIPVASLIETHLWTIRRSIDRGERLTSADDPENSMRRLEMELAHKAERSAPSSRRPGRPATYTEDHWREVADVYRGHGGRARRKAVAEHFSIPLKKADNWIAEARRKGFLPPYGDTAGGGKR
jgi:hypothetical protein